MRGQSPNQCAGHGEEAIAGIALPAAVGNAKNQFEDVRHFSAPCVWAALDPTPVLKHPPSVTKLTGQTLASQLNPC